MHDQPISGDESCKDYFPHFFWLIRDCNTEHSDGRSFTDYIKEEYLIPKKGKDSGRSQILSLFPSFTCHKVVRPGGKEPHDTRIDDLDERFDAGIKNAIIQLCDKIDIKRGLNDVSLTSDMFIDLAEQYIKALNADDHISDLNLSWKITCQTRLEALSKKLILSYQEEMQNLKFPVEEDQIKKPDEVTLFGMHSTIKNEIQSQLHQECQKLLPHEKNLTSKIEEDFEEAISKQLTELRKGNHLQSIDYCSKIFSEIDDTQTLEDMKKLYMDKAMGPAKHDVFNSKTSHISGPPVIKVFHKPQKNKVTLTWDKPEINPDAARKFEIEIKEQNESTWKQLSNDVHSPLDITYSTSKELLPNHVYQVRIRGYNELKRGIGDFSEPHTITIPCGVPSKPVCPTIQVCMKDPTKVILQVATLSKLQENGKPVKKIIIQKKTHNNKWITEMEHNYESNGESTWRGYTLNLDNMKIPTSFQVIMRNDIGDSVPSEPVVLDHTIIIPGQPVNLKHGEITSNSIQLLWDKPKINPLATHKYEVVCITTEWRAYTDKCSLEIKNLSPHTEYIFEVKALNSRDFGTQQQSVIHVETKLPKPVKPKPVVTVECDEIRATIQLNKSEEPKQFIIMMYDEKRNKSNEGGYKFILGSLENVLTVACKIPYDDKFYFISVLCKNDDAESDPSDLVSVNPVGHSIQPGSPLSLKHRTDGNTVTLRWDKPEKKARAVTGYWIQKKLSSDDEKEWRYLEKIIEENQFTAEIKQLKYYTEYDFRVCAFNANIRGKYSEVLKLRTGCGRPAKPLRPSIKYQEDDKALVLTIQPISSEDECGSKVTHVIIEHQHNEKKWERMKKEINESRNYEIPKEITKHSKEFRVCLQNGEGISEPSDPCSISTQMNNLIPGAIENPKLESKTGNSIDLCWDKPKLNSHAVTGYCIKMKKKGEYEIMESDEPKIKVTGLEEDTEYKFEICAKGPFNDGKDHPLEGKTIEVFPGKPTNLRAHKKRDDCIKYRWEPPNEHPEAVAYYEVECKHHVLSTSIKKKVTEASHSTVIRGLESNTYYDIEVTAYNKFNHHHPDSSILLPKIDTKFNTPTRISLSILAGLPTFTIGGIAAYYATKPDPEEECESSDEEYK